jgi:UDP-N-acetylglucosamine--N-acetylmuramyl-(pentapeptide) pyrophosphoryl-undecaprenol N-acetylglucosamine transferase
MKIVLTGGGTGGHFYPLIAIAESVRQTARDQHLIKPTLYYIAPSAFDQEALFENEIRFITCPAGKWRRYFSFQNFTDLFVSAFGLLSAWFTLFSIFPDVVVSKGGYASVPVTLAAKLLGIPVIIHESDAKPGRANIMASKFARRIAITFNETASFFPEKVQDRIARTGIPIRSLIQQPDANGAHAHFGLDPALPTILILGGSSGAERVNDVVMEALPNLTAFANVLHQTGKTLIKVAESTAKVVLQGAEHPERYHPVAYLSAMDMRFAAGAANLVISRAGMTAIAEIAIWKKPSILIPIPETISHDQRTNAYAYARTGAATVLEEGNINGHILFSEAQRILSSPDIARDMAEKTALFANTDAGTIIAQEVIAIALPHETKS